MGKRERGRLGRQLCSAVVFLLLSLGGARPASADLAVMANGAVLKIDAFQVLGDRVQLSLSTGGEMVIPLMRVERIVDDEIEPAPPPPPPVPAGFRMGFLPEDPVPEVPYGELVHATAQRHGLNPALVAAVIRAESASNPRAVSHKGARGLMQLMPATAARFGVSSHELFEPARNLEAGVRYLAFLVDRFDGALDLVLAGYNAGEGAVKRHGGVPPYRETRGYISRIRRFLGYESGSAPPSPIARK